MLLYADTFPVRQPHLSLSPDIKFFSSRDSPNSPFSPRGSPNAVTLVSTEAPAGSQALGFPLWGAGWVAMGHTEPLQGGPCSPAHPRDSAAGGVVSSWSLCQPLPHPQPLCFSKAHTANVLSMLLHPPPTAPIPASSLSSSKRPTCCPDPNPPCAWASPCSPHAKYSMDLPGCMLNPSPQELWSSKRFPLPSSSPCSSTQNSTSHLRY